MNPIKFSDLLKTGILEIQRHESHTSKKLLKEIHAELGQAIGRKASTIEYYLKGHTPRALYELEQLARELFTRGHLGKEWLEQFLASGGHPDTLRLCGRLLTSREEDLDHSGKALFKRRRMHVVREFLWNGVTESHTEVEIEVTSDSPLQSVRHTNTVDVVERIEPIHLQFKSGYRDGIGTMQSHIMRNDLHRMVWTVEFVPPLLKNQRASYSYFQRQRSISLQSYENCSYNFQAGRTHGFFTYWRYKMSVPTDELYVKHIFPPEYQLVIPPTGGFGVYLGYSENLEEKTKITASNGFSACLDKATNRWTMELLVHNAKMGHFYQLDWIPPRLASIEAHQHKQ